MSYVIEMPAEQSNQMLSLYIPHVFPNFTSEYIASVFENLDFGRIDHVDLVSKQDKNGKMYNAAYVHFAVWYEGPAILNFQERVVDPNKEARIVHDDPWYWIILENKAKKVEPGVRKPIINLSENNKPEVIAPGVSEVVLMHDKIDALIAEHFNEPIDASCEFEDFVEDEISRLKAENEHLRSTITMHYNHANHCHQQLASLRREIDELRQENYELEEELQEVRQENFALEELVDDGLIVKAV